MAGLIHMSAMRLCGEFFMSKEPSQDAVCRLKNECDPIKNPQAVQSAIEWWNQVFYTEVKIGIIGPARCGKSTLIHSMCSTDLNIRPVKGDTVVERCAKCTHWINPHNPQVSYYELTVLPGAYTDLGDLVKNNILQCQLYILMGTDTMMTVVLRHLYKFLIQFGHVLFLFNISNRGNSPLQQRYHIAQTKFLEHAGIVTENINISTYVCLAFDLTKLDGLLFIRNMMRQLGPIKGFVFILSVPNMKSCKMQHLKWAYVKKYIPLLTLVISSDDGALKSQCSAHTNSIPVWNLLIQFFVEWLNFAQCREFGAAVCSLRQYSLTSICQRLNQYNYTPTLLKSGIGAHQYSQFVRIKVNEMGIAMTSQLMKFIATYITLFCFNNTVHNTAKSSKNCNFIFGFYVNKENELSYPTSSSSSPTSILDQNNHGDIDELSEEDSLEAQDLKVGGSSEEL